MLRSFLTTSAYRPHSRFFDRGIFFAPEGDQGSGGTQQLDPQSIAAQVVQQLASQRGGVEPAAAYLVQQNATLQQQLDALKGKQIPDGALVLTGDQVALWNALKDFKPDEIAKWKSDLDAAQGQLSAVERKKLITRAADAVGYKASVLSKLPDLPAVEVTEKDKDGKKVPFAEVVKDGVRTPLADYVAANYADFLPALQATQQRTGITYPPQTGASGNTQTDIINDFIAKQQERAASAPNALVRK